MADEHEHDPRPVTKGQLSTKLPGVTTYLTGHNDDGKSIVHEKRESVWAAFDDNTMAFSVPYTNTFKADLNKNADIEDHDARLAAGKLGLVNPNGAVLRYVDFAPGKESLMHRTSSVDFGIVLEGTVEMVLDDGSVTLMRRGDVAVQRATMHAWRNPSKEVWTRMLFVLQDIEKLTVNGEVMKEDLSQNEGSRIPPSGND